MAACRGFDLCRGACRFNGTSTALTQLLHPLPHTYQALQSRRRALDSETQPPSARVDAINIADDIARSGDVDDDAEDGLEYASGV